MNSADFTIVVVPRERFSMAKTSLLDLLEKSSGEFPLIYLDGNSPPALASWLEEQSRERGFRLIRIDHYISQHGAYNIILPLITTKYVLFCDNDVTFSQGWNERLVKCAEETGAALVGPLFLEQMGTCTQIHSAGCHIILKREKGRLVYNEHPILHHRPLHEAESLPERQETANIEYHAFLGRMDVLRSMNPFDPNLLSAREHSDLGLRLKAAGKISLIDKSCTVTYHVPPPLDPDDLPFYRTRWSEKWIGHSYASFSKKWGLRVAVSPWFAQHRRAGFEKWTAPLTPLIGWRNARRVYYRILDPLVRLLEPAYNRAYYERVFGTRNEHRLGIADLSKPYPGTHCSPLPPGDSVFKIED